MICIQKEQFRIQCKSDIISKATTNFKERLLENEQHLKIKSYTNIMVQTNRTSSICTEFEIDYTPLDDCSTGSVPIPTQSQRKPIIIS